MTPLAGILAARIAATGPITIADYMAECLTHPRHGYYATRDPFGQAGDFTTAPEISQMFGELIGLFLARCWLDQGRPDPFVLAEIGPGRGTLMADALRAMRTVPGLVDAARLHLVDTSPTLRARQAATLGAAVTAWHDRVEDLPEGPLYLVANEFFDALPIRQFLRSGSGWRERHVTVAEGQLAPAFGPETRYGDLTARLADMDEGGMVETCPAMPAIATEIARRIAAHGGVALAIDYGGWPSRGDTLQALRAHRFEDPFATPGEADLTAHVDFAALAAAFRGAGCGVSAMTPQGAFLNRLGIAERTEALARNLGGAALQSHLAAHRRLTDAEEMGQLFKVLACYPAGNATPPGLDPMR